MDEGVDPTHMCQSLVDKVFQSKQLKAVADPEILVLFEDWLEELEEEIISEIKKSPAQDPSVLAKGLGLSKSGTIFLITKLQREGRI
jgi:DNA-binding Lrp family transcriptional regulator